MSQNQNTIEKNILKQWDKGISKNIFQTTKISMQKFLHPPFSIRKCDVWYTSFIRQTNRCVGEEKKIVHKLQAYLG